MTDKLKLISATILTALIFAAALLLPTAAIQAQSASVSQSPVDLGLLNGKATVLAKPSDPFEVVYGTLSGEVKVAVTVNEKGDVIKAEAVSGDEKLRYAAVIAAEASKFTPYQVKGKPAKFSGFLLFNFGSADKNKAALDDLNTFLAEQEKEYVAKTQELSDKKDYAGVIKFLDSNKISRYDSDALELRANANFNLKQYDEALKDITKSIDLSLGVKPLKVSYKYMLRGDIYKAQYNYVSAEADYRKALEIDPNNASLKDKLKSLSGQKSGDTAAIAAFQRDLKASLEEFDRLKPDYEKKVAAFNQLLESEKKKTGNADVLGLCKSLLAVKADWVRLDPIINKMTDKISDLQNKDKVDEYFDGATIQLAQSSEMISWTGETYMPEKEKYVYLFDKLGCKALEKP